jgi:DNA end-binding protein Ku
MAPRANWKGYLRLSLVSCPIALYPASSVSEKVSFNRINRKTGNRLKQQNVDSETGEVVSRDDMVRGYEVAKGQYMIVEDEEIEAFRSRARGRSISISSFQKMKSTNVTSTRRTTLLLMAQLARRRSPSSGTPSRS